jgi:hypothetical protein
MIDDRGQIRLERHHLKLNQNKLAVGGVVLIGTPNRIGF